MNNREFNNEQGSLIEYMDRSTSQLSKRKYLMALTSFVTVGFLAIILGYQLTGANELTRSLGGLYAFIIGNRYTVFAASLIVSIAGIIIMSIGRKKESVPATAVGYIMLIMSFGLTIGLLLRFYAVSTIFMALLITSVIFVVFSILGFILPDLFANIRGTLFVLPIAALVVSLIFIFLGYDPVWTDLAIILVFCGFMGYSMYKAMHDEPTYANALFYAASLYLNIIAIFLRVVSLLNRK